MRGTGFTLAALLAAGLVLPSAALACRFLPYEPAEAPIFGESCEMSRILAQDRLVRLGPALDLGHGLTLQTLEDGNGCDMQVHLVVHDCATADVLRFGPEPRIAGDDDQSRHALDDLAAYLQATPQVTLAMAEDRAAGLGLAAPERRYSGQTVQAGDFGVTTGCACSLFYEGGGG